MDILSYSPRTLGTMSGQRRFRTPEPELPNEAGGAGGSSGCRRVGNEGLVRSKVVSPFLTSLSRALGSHDILRWVFSAFRTERVGRRTVSSAPGERECLCLVLLGVLIPRCLLQLFESLHLFFFSPTNFSRPDTSACSSPAVTTAIPSS